MLANFMKQKKPHTSSPVSVRKAFIKDVAAEKSIALEHLDSLVELDTAPHNAFGYLGLGIMLLAVTNALLLWHGHLSNMMNSRDRSVQDHFYQEHAIYLWLTAVQWMIGLAIPPLLFKGYCSRNQILPSETS